MLEIDHKKSYIKDLFRLVNNGLDTTELDNAINKLRNGEILESKYKDHVLQGKLKEYREFHLKGDILVLYKIDKTTLTLYAIDNHNKLFKRFTK